jgi:hypothetical protein
MLSLLPLRYERAYPHSPLGWCSERRREQLREWAESYPPTFADKHALVLTAQLDVETVVKASQAISSEMVLPELIAKLVRVAVENAGAERA